MTNIDKINIKNSLKINADRESNDSKYSKLLEINVHNLKNDINRIQDKQEYDLKDLDDKKTNIKECNISIRKTCFASTNDYADETKISTNFQDENQDNPNINFINNLSEKSELELSTNCKNNPIESLSNNFNQMNLNKNIDRTNQSLNYFEQNNLIKNNNNLKILPLSSINTEVIQSTQNNITKQHIITSFADTNSTKILQKIVNEAQASTINAIVNELKGTFHSIIKNKNGNYFAKDLFCICDTKQRIEILKELYRTISDDCTDKFASHPIQVLVDYSSCEEEYNLILESFYDYNKALLACLDPNGSFVIQKIIKHIPEKYRMKFNQIFISFLCFIIRKKFGVINSKTFVDYAKNEENINQIINNILDDFNGIATDPFGNYFIQHILEKWFNYNEFINIKVAIVKQFRVLFENKYSLHICELFLKLANNEDKTLLINSFNFNTNNSTDKKIMIRIMCSFQKNLSNNRNNNHNNNNNNSNNLRNPNLLYSNMNTNMNMNNFNNYNSNNTNTFINQNQLPLSLNNLGRNNMINNNNNAMIFKNNYINDKK